MTTPVENPAVIENLRVLFDDARGFDLDTVMLSGDVLAGVDALDVARAADDALAELQAAETLMALLKRLMTPARGVILQNRDRSTPAMIAQMNAIASAPDYYRVAPTKEFASGTPIVFGNGDLLPSKIAFGRNDKAVAADGRRFVVQYAVVEADDLLTSNAADGIANADYTNGVPGKLRAIAGNGRLAGLKAAYQRSTTDDYRVELAQDDMTGLAPGALDAFTAPILVRVMRAEDVTENIGDISNQRGTSDLSPVEQAQNDAKRIDLADIDVADDGKPTEAAALAFIAAMPESERNNLMDGKHPGQKAYDRLMATVFWKAYDAPELVRLYAQSVDSEIKTILGGMASAAAELARLDGAGDLDIRGVVTEAASLAVNAKRQGVKLADFAKQTDMTLSLDTMEVVRMFVENIRSAKKIGERLRAAARFAYEEFTKEDSDMFGAVEKATRPQVLDRLKADPVDPTMSLFDSVDPLRALELSGSLLEKVEALTAAGDDDPLAVLTLSDEILAIIRELEGAPANSDLPAATAHSAQYESYRRAIEEAKAAGTLTTMPGLLEQIRADERLNDGEADELLALATEGKPAGEEAPVVPDPVVPGTLSDATMQTYITAAADSIAALRRIDVYRVLNGLAADNVDGVTRSDLATWIAMNRPDLVKEVTDVMAEEYAADGWTLPEDTEDGEWRAKQADQPLPPGPVVVPPVVPDPGPAPTVNPKRADDLAFFEAVAAEKVDMWDDQLADKLEAMIAAYGGDDEMREAWTRAVNAYTNFMVNAMKGV
ncbi:hypothetical protein LA345_39060 (plasmid) [Burkholderia vietnamiensis]|uniref:Uncharacterized protein n=1 Tax=Burkholderia vietnamiensis (strain G4 / LMG 22486) TaxID=269482 RepID=A4JWH1_BURVG|nr:hypothetical protein Bcep1808_7754 [Burkholderia vietnamiensis G4]MCB4349800.1 hypothetical protein [Burkholderia vietnamiensis]